MTPSCAWVVHPRRKLLRDVRFDHFATTAFVRHPPREVHLFMSALCSVLHDPQPESLAGAYGVDVYGAQLWSMRPALM